MLCCAQCSVFRINVLCLDGGCLSNEQSEGKVMYGPAEQAEWVEEKSQPEPTVSVPCGLFLAI